ncbi:putative uncharacterized protein [Burkholderiales bacterium GJ-E10]|nr:putative uncharacterized protein [Burkholderiales bacterium GJ-E10]
MRSTRISQCGIAAFAVVTAMAVTPRCAHAQWAWRDSGGHVTFSDSPPPANIPQSQIFEQPNPASMPATPPAGSNAKTTAQRDANAEKRFDKWFKKRQEAEQRQEAAQARRNAECNRLRGHLATLQTLGMQVLQQDPNGGAPTFLSDQQRAAQAQQLQNQISANCD